MSRPQISMVGDNSESYVVVRPDKYTDDNLLKHKIRSINLLKHNPNLFVNKNGSKFLECIGGQPTLLTILGFGGLGIIYRMRANSLRQLGFREGLWFNFGYFLFGSITGAAYSCLLFVKWQMLVNDYFGNYLIKRYAGCGNIDRTNIYQMRNVENTDEVYRFSPKFLNNYHM